MYKAKSPDPAAENPFNSASITIPIGTKTMIRFIKSWAFTAKSSSISGTASMPNLLASKITDVNKLA